MDKNTVIGITLIFALFFAWQYFTSPSQEELEAQQRIQDSIAMAERRADSLAQLSQEEPSRSADTNTIANNLPDSVRQAQLSGSFGPFAAAASGNKEEVVLENDKLKITFSSKGGQITDALVKDYFKIVKDADQQDVKIPLHLMEDAKNRFEYFLPVSSLPSGGVSTADLYFKPSVSGNTVTFRADIGEGRYIEQTYTLKEEYHINYQLNFVGLNNIISRDAASVKLNWINYLDKIEKNTRIERTYATVYYKKVDKRTDNCSRTSTDTEDAQGVPVKWVSNSNQFFNTTLMAETAFGGAYMESNNLDEDAKDLKKLVSNIDVPFGHTANEQFGMEMYIGPNKFEDLKTMGFDVEDIIPFGWNIFGTINRWIIRPLFNFLSGFIGSAGLVILALTLLVKAALYPLTYRMLYSQSKMQALKPEIEKMRERHKDDQQKQQMETMKLYREFGVNPLGSCLPLLLQMPIWFALYRFFPASIEFRQEGFWWANDLSSYDEFFQLPFTIPLGIGSHISLFTILWAITTLIYTFYNSRHMDFGSNPAMKYMQYIMPLFFLGFFNSYASGLTAYLLFSNLTNITQTIITKNYVINQEKIREQMHAYSKKPKKKSGFQQRLQSALEEQRKIQEKQKKERDNKRKK